MLELISTDGNMILLFIQLSGLLRLSETCGDLCFKHLVYVLCDDQVRLIASK